MEDTVSNKIRDHFSEQETIDLVAKLVSFPSHEGVENQETETAKYIYDFFIREGIEAELIPVEDGRCNVIATLKGTGGGKTLLLTGTYRYRSALRYAREIPMKPESKTAACMAAERWI